METDEHKPAPIVLKEVTITPEAFEEKLEKYKRLLGKVPKRRADLYQFPISWNMLAQNRILEKRLVPFVSKLLSEYFGQDDRALVQMVVRMIANRESARGIEGKVYEFLDEKAEEFVRRVWRMLIFEHMKLENSNEWP